MPSASATKKTGAGPAGTSANAAVPPTWLSGCGVWLAPTPVLVASWASFGSRPTSTVAAPAADKRGVAPVAL
eukprot:11165259-Lingulodinium_polyedra.AAC.1